MSDVKTEDRQWKRYEPVYYGATVTALDDEEHGPLPTNRFFLYGIFLSQSRRDSFGMYNAQYETVQGFVTRGGGIVQAERTDDKGLALTGVTVSINPAMIPQLDSLEGGYDRIAVVSNSGERLWMYAKKGTVSD